MPKLMTQGRIGREREAQCRIATRLTLACWPRLLDVHLAACYLSVGKQTVRDYVVAGLLKPVELPGSILRDRNGKVVASPGQRKIAKLLLAREDLDAFVDERKGAAARAGIMPRTDRRENADDR